MPSRRRPLSGAPSPSPFPPPSSPHATSTGFQTVLIIVLFSSITLVFLLLSYYTILRHHTPRRHRRNHPLPPLPVPHHVWLVRTPGLTFASIASLPLVKRTGNAAFCAVCLGEVSEGELCRVLPKCGHVFHVFCVDMWLRGHATCPVCRVVVEVEGREVGRVWSDLGRERVRGGLRRAVSMGEVRVSNGESSSGEKADVEEVGGTNVGSFLARFRGRSGSLL